jgi:hypothetical protein
MILPTILATVRVPDRDLVYAARYYYQGSRKSYSQIYLCRHDGTNRIQLTRNKFDSTTPMWIDRTHIAYFKKGFVPDESIPRTQRLATFNAVVYDVVTGTKKKIGGFRTSSESWILSAKGNILAGGLADRGKTWETVYFLVTPDKVKIISKKEVETRYPNIQAKATRQGEFRHQVGNWSLSWTVPNQASILLNGKFKLQGNLVERALVGKGGIGILATKSSNRPDQFLYRFANGYGTCSPISSRIGAVDVNPSSLFWSATQTGDAPGSVGKLRNGVRVGVNRLVVGNLKTGQQWTVAKGLVAVAGSQMRP